MHRQVPTLPIGCYAAEERSTPLVTLLQNSFPSIAFTNMIDFLFVLCPKPRGKHCMYNEDENKLKIKQIIYLQTRSYRKGVLVYLVQWHLTALRIVLDTCLVTLCVESREPSWSSSLNIMFYSISLSCSTYIKLKWDGI